MLVAVVRVCLPDQDTPRRDDIRYIFQSPHPGTTRVEPRLKSLSTKVQRARVLVLCIRLK